MIWCMAGLFLGIIWLFMRLGSLQERLEEAEKSLQVAGHRLDLQRLRMEAIERAEDERVGPGMLNRYMAEKN